MRYRKLDAQGDYQLGQNVFHTNTPEAVAQAVLTRLRLWLGEWFVDTRDGTPWNEQILGKRLPTRRPDAAIQRRILGTQGVTEIVSYSSAFVGDTRRLSVSAQLNTVYGPATLQYTQ